MAKGADSTLYTAKPLTFLPERSILLVRLVAFNHKEVLHDTRRILGENPVQKYSANIDSYYDFTICSPPLP